MITKLLEFHIYNRIARRLPSHHLNKINLALILGSLSLIFMLAICIAGDMRPMAAIADTDFITALYAAGHMVNNGVGHDIYPALNAHDFYNEKFATYTRALLQKPDQQWLYLFTYPGAVAVLCAPFALLEPRLSLVAWQIFSIIALFGAARCFAILPATRANALTVFLLSCMFLPMLDVVVVGQTSLVLGLFPLAAGYYFWQRERFFAAGLVWAIMGLKPQIALPIAVIAGALLLACLLKKVEKAEALRIVAGLLCGTFFLHAIPSFILGADSFALWLNAVRMSGAAFAAEKTGYWQYHLFCSLPCLTVLGFPKELWLSVRQISYLAGLLALCLSTIACARIIKDKMDPWLRRDLMMVLATPIVLLSAPHLLLYDTCILLLPAWILFFRLQGTSLFVRWGRIGALVTMFAYNLYLLVLLTQGGYPGLHWQLFIVLEITVLLIGLFYLANKEELSS